MEQGILQATGYPAEMADFYSAISAGYWGVFLVAKIVLLVMKPFELYLRKKGGPSKQVHVWQVSKAF